MNVAKEKILHLSHSLRDDVIAWRRYFHMHPELSYRETITSSYISEWLAVNNIEFRSGIAGTGVLGYIRGRGTGNRVVGIRAEMDALPVTEKEGAFSSLNRGVMHACGHDAHMAMVMGAALLMRSIDDLFGGTIILIFQPGEEKNPGGAKLMIESGALNDPRPDLFLAHHVLPDLETGKVGYRAGRYMASCDEIYLTVRGKGGHAALPALTTDQILIASNLVIALKKTMAEAQAENNYPTVLGIGKISGEGATNVIPDKVEIAGTFRTFDEGWRIKGHDIIRSVSASVAREYGVQVDVTISEGYPVLVNDEKLTAKAVDLSRQLLGESNVEMYDIRMSSDDFSFYSSLAPSLYYRVGIRSKGSEMKKLHTPEFAIDEEGLTTGVANMCWLLYNFLTDTAGQS